MLKRFFISMLGTMAGIWISIILIFVGGFLLIGYALGKSVSDTTITVEKRSILYFDLSGAVNERYTQQPFFTMIQSLNREQLTLEDMLLSLDAAADDDRIEGLYIKCDGAAMGTASREELIEAIEDFRESGKWVAAYSDSYEQGDYLVASTADSLFLNPVGSVNIHGVGGMTPFFKGLLDKLGVKMQIIKVGTFKSAVEPYIMESMSAPARLQMQQFCDSIWGYISGTISANRGLSQDSVEALAPQMIFTREAETFVADGLVDGLKYERQMDNFLRGLTGIDSDKDLRLITPSAYLTARGSELNFGGERDHVAVYYAVGDIVDGGEGGIVGSEVTKDITKLADDKHVRGLVLRVNSPGGSAFASEQIWEALQYFKSKGKPLYVSMGDYAASGGYYISCSADTIYADATTITGSIGVFGMIPDFSGLVTDKLGVRFSTVETNPNAVGLTTVEAMTPAQHAAMQKSVDNIYELFTSRVAEGREMPQDSVKAIAEGRVWIATRAIELGLVDYIGSLATATAAMSFDLGLPSEAVVRYPRTDEKLWEKLLRESGGLDAVKATGLDEETLRDLQYIKRLREMNPMQARMEEIIIK